MTPSTTPAGSRAAPRAVRLACLLMLLGGVAGAASAAGDHAGGHVHAPASGTDAIGQPGLAAEADRTIVVDMTDDMRFTPAEITVRQGETVRFALSNSGRLRHELVLGTEQDLKAHDAAMARNPEMEHADPKMLTLAPGARGEIVWRFTRGGRVDFACLQPGHYAAGMKGLVRVAAGPADASGTVDPASASAPADAGDLTDGEVRRIDRDAVRITLRHGPLKNLDMPGMTMVFDVADAAVLDRLRPGEKVRFQAGKVDGRFVVTRIEPAASPASSSR